MKNRHSKNKTNSFAEIRNQSISQWWTYFVSSIFSMNNLLPRCRLRRLICKLTATHAYISSLSRIFRIQLPLVKQSIFTENKIKTLKTLVWHLSREPMKEMSSLKKYTNSNVWRTIPDGQGKGITISGTN